MPKHFPATTQFSEKYEDDRYEYRHFTLSREDYNKLPEDYVRYYDSKNQRRIQTENEFMERELARLKNGTYDESTEVMYQKLLTETEWRNAGVTQGMGWKHYLVFPPEDHVLLFRRVLGTDTLTGQPPAA